MRQTVYIWGTPERFANYRRWVESAGGRAVFGKDAGGRGIRWDALLLPGGGDLEPWRYGRENTASRGLEPERDDNAVLTRGEVVRMLLDAAGYGPAARLRGIYTCAYSDKGSIPAEELGYAALAQALGLASGTYAGSRTATRGEAASMLCRVLERAA